MIPIAKIASEFGEIVVSRSKATGAIRYDQGQIHQSEADADGISLVAYIHAIFDLLLQAGCRNILLIGCGGGTLATMLHRAGAAVTIADIDAQSFHLARQYFRLPAEVICHAVDGAAFLAASAQIYDGIVLDAYVGNRLPPQFASPEFLGVVRDRLRPETGLFIANLYKLDDSDPAAERFAEAAAAFWSDCRLLDAPGVRNRNALVLAGAAASLNRPALRTAPAFGVDEIAADLARLTFQR